MSAAILDAVVVGGGISGLAIAHGLARRGFELRLIEASERFGGVLKSARREGFLFEHGPNTVLATSAEVERLVDEVGLAERIQWADSKAGKRYIARRGKLHAVPTGPGAMLTSRLFTTCAKFRLLKEPWIKAEDPEAYESVASFVARRLGPEFLDYAINPMVAGVYAGRPEELEIRSVFPKIHALEREHGSLIRGMIRGAKERKAREASGDVARDRARLFSFPEGLEELPRAIAVELGERAEAGTRVLEIHRDDESWRVVTEAAGGRQETRRARAVVLAVDTPALLRLVPGEALALLEEAPHPPIAVVGMAWKDEPGGRLRDGFGYLIPEKEAFSSLGTLWSSSLFPGRAPGAGAVLTSFVGGRRHPELVSLDDEALAAKVQADLLALMGIERAPDHLSIERYEASIPQYTLGHHRRIAAVERFEAEQPGAFVAANVVRGVSVGDRIRVGAELVERIAESLQSESDSKTTALPVEKASNGT